MLGVNFEIRSADADESSDIKDPATLVQALAARKGEAVRALMQDAGEWDEETLIIAADTVVAAGDEILGKPRDAADAAAMLQKLQGTGHRVISGVALFMGARSATAAEETVVRFGPMTEQEIADYVKSGEPMDKAGAYAVQGLASVYIEGLVGDYFNVVGLPVHRLDSLLHIFAGLRLTGLGGD